MRHALLEFRIFLFNTKYYWTSIFLEKFKNYNELFLYFYIKPHETGSDNISADQPTA